jgi:hypothetical protein
MLRGEGDRPVVNTSLGSFQRMVTQAQPDDGLIIAVVSANSGLAGRHPVYLKEDAPK